MPPPRPVVGADAELPVKVLLSIFTVPFANMPPPYPVVAVLPDTVLLRIVVVELEVLYNPPPSIPAVLPDTTLLLNVSIAKAALLRAFFIPPPSD